jgi:GntR family carbon starvation induced transcriptional regulator
MSLPPDTSETTSNVSSHDAGQPGTRKADTMLEDMRLDLITGDLVPGDRVKIHDLTERYNVSQTTIREVLPKLAAEGLLVEAARKGYQVAAISLKDLDDLMQIRIDLELPALRQSAIHGGAEWEVGILRAQHMMRLYQREHKGAERLEQTRGWITVHAAFHAALIAGSPSLRRRVYCRNLFDQSSRYFWLAANSLPSSIDNLASHIELADLALAGEVELATKMLRKHIEKAHADVKAFLVNDSSTQA